MFILFTVSSVTCTLPGKCTDSRNICGLNKWILLFSYTVNKYSSNKYLLTLYHVPWIVLKPWRQNDRHWSLKRIDMVSNLMGCTMCIVRKTDTSQCFRGRQNGTSEALKRKELGEPAEMREARVRKQQTGLPS